MTIKHCFGVETEKNPEVWADNVSAYYDEKAEERCYPITLPDTLLWAMPAVDITPLLAKRGIKLAICEQRGNYIATFIDRVE